MLFMEVRNEVEKHDLLVALNRLPILQHDLKTLRKMNNEEIVVQAKVKKYAFLEAKKRYEALSSVEKLKSKVNGKKLYEYARSGKSVTLPKKEVTIKEIELLSKNSSSFTFRTLVTKGCYIRSLIQDISKELGVYATMSKLIRTKQGVVSIDMSNTIDDLLNNNYRILSIEECLDYPIVIINDDDKFKVSNGVRLENKWNIEDRVIFKDSNNRLLGIYEVRDNMLVTWKNFN